MLTALLSGVLIAGGGVYIAIGIGLIVVGVCLMKGIRGG